jgi:hypothetical protein
MQNPLQTEAKRTSLTIIGSLGSMPPEFIVPFVSNLFVIVENEIRLKTEKSESLVEDSLSRVSNSVVDYLFQALNESAHVQNVSEIESKLADLIATMPRLKEAFDVASFDINCKENLLLVMKELDRQKQISRLLKT